MNILPTQHAPFSVEPVGSQQQAREPCARKVVPGWGHLWGAKPSSAWGSPTARDSQHPSPALGYAPGSVKHTEHARRRGIFTGQGPQHPLPVDQSSALGTHSLQRAPHCQTNPQRGAGSGIGAVLAASKQELSSSLLRHLFGSVLRRLSRDQVAEPAHTPKPSGSPGLMTGANPFPLKLDFCCLLSVSRC